MLILSGALFLAVCGAAWAWRLAAESERVAARALAVVRASERKYRRIFEESRDAIVLTDRAGRVLDMNQAGLDLFGYRQEQLADLPVQELYGRGEDRQQLLSRFDRADDLRAMPFKARRSDDTVFDAEITVSVLERDLAGRVALLQAIVRDVTVTRGLERQIQQAQKMEAIGRLAGGVAHDFNNLLTAIIGYTELLISSLPPADPRLQDAYEVRRAAASAAQLTKHLLAFSRRQRTAAEVLDLNDVAARMAGMLRRTLGDDVTLALDLDHTVGRVKADPTHIDQIVLNLAVNARDAMPRGGTLTVRTESFTADRSLAAVMTPGDYVRLTVSDTGCGIPEEIQSRIFEPFFTTKGAAGTGIGLATVYGIVKQYGGYVSFTSAAGAGTTFTIDLPLTKEPRVSAASDDTPPRLVEGHATVLLVEDDPRVRELASLVLRRAGHEVICAEGPRDALTLIRGEAAIDLVVTDVVMPEMNGYDLAEELRKIAPGVRVVFMSGFANDVLYRPISDPFLSKPFTVESLTDIVAGALAIPAA